MLSDHPDQKSSVHPDLDPRSRPSAPCDIKAGTNMVSSEINLDILFNKTSLLQESHCLNTKIIKDNDVEVPEVNVKVSEVDVQGVVDFIEARLHQGVDAAHTHTVPVVKPHRPRKKEGRGVQLGEANAASRGDDVLRGSS